MDTSDTYIKMCEKAWEIQPTRDELWYRHMKAGDLYYEPGVGVTFEKTNWVTELGIWLPRQDQLQEMLNLKLWRLNGRFYDWLFSSVEDGWHINHQHLNFNSMEQLWFAFMMKENHNKVWNGEDWAK